MDSEERKRKAEAFVACSVSIDIEEEGIQKNCNFDPMLHNTYAVSLLSQNAD